MSGLAPARWMDRAIGWCFGVLLATIALFCAVKLIENILPALVVIVGTLTLIGLVVLVAIVVFRTLRNRW